MNGNTNLQKSTLLTIKQAAQQKNCNIMTIRRAIKRDQLIATVLNPEDHPKRHVVRIVDNEQFQKWQPSNRRNQMRAKRIAVCVYDGNSPQIEDTVYYGDKTLARKAIDYWRANGDDNWVEQIQPSVLKLKRTQPGGHIVALRVINPDDVISWYDKYLG